MAEEPATGVTDVLPAQVALDAQVLVLRANGALAADDMDVVRGDAADAVEHQHLDVLRLEWVQLSLGMQGAKDVAQEHPQRSCNTL